MGSTTTDRKQRRLAEKGDPKYISTIPKAILPKPSLCDEISDEIMKQNHCFAVSLFAVSLSRSVDLARIKCMIN